MTNNRLSEGVGKKIVEALKKQSEIEVNAIPSSSNVHEESAPVETESINSFANELEEAQALGFEEEDLLSSLSFNEDLDNFSAQPEVAESEASIDTPIEEPVFSQPSVVQPSVSAAFSGISQPAPSVADNFVSELDNFEVPSNIAVLKKLISQLPSGVTRSTGAQIIRQTMEALGISMKSVLQEAQQLQDGLSNSAKECQNTIQEYKKQIINLEKQSQNHQRQYSALNELISLFIQTR